MPYKRTWVKPEPFLEYRGIRIYYCYVDEDIDCPKSETRFTTNPDGPTGSFCLQNFPLSSPAFTREINLKRAIEGGYILPEKRTEHDLYTELDKDAPDQIKDRNGEIVLGQCKLCGKVEIELEEPCTKRRSGGSPEARYANSLLYALAHSYPKGKS